MTIIEIVAIAGLIIAVPSVIINISQYAKRRKRESSEIYIPIIEEVEQVRRYAEIYAPIPSLMKIETLKITSSKRLKTEINRFMELCSDYNRAKRNSEYIVKFHIWDGAKNYLATAFINSDRKSWHSGKKSHGDVEDALVEAFMNPFLEGKEISTSWMAENCYDLKQHIEAVTSEKQLNEFLKSLKREINRPYIEELRILREARNKIIRFDYKFLKKKIA